MEEGRKLSTISYKSRALECYCYHKLNNNNNNKNIIVKPTISLLDIQII